MRFLKGVFCFFLVGCFLYSVCFAGQWKERDIKYLADSGAVTTNNKAGALDYVFLTSNTAGDSININDGATTKLTLIVPSANDFVEWKAPDNIDIIFSTDIDVVYLTHSGATYATIVYREIQ